MEKIMSEKKENYKIPKYEERLKKIKELREKIDNPEPERLLTDHQALQNQLADLGDKKTMLYQEIKKIIKAGRQLILRDNGQICYFSGEWSEAGHPGLCYFWADTLNPTGPITTYRGIKFEEIMPKEFMTKLMTGEGFLSKNI